MMDWFHSVDPRALACECGARRGFRLTCDECVFAPTMREFFAPYPAARDLAIIAGWARDGARWTCPRCRGLPDPPPIEENFSLAGALPGTTPNLETDNEPRPDATTRARARRAYEHGGEYCARCGRALGPEPHIAFTDDGRQAFVGGKCFQMIRAAGAEGLPTLGGWLVVR